MTLPQGWAVARVDELAGPNGFVSDGDWVESKDQDPAGKVRLTQLADVGEGVFRDRSQRFMSKEAAERLRCTYLQAGDVLIARMPDPIGRACIFPELNQPAVTAVDVMIWRTDGELADAEWFVRCINSPAIRKLMADGAGGTTRQRIAGGRVKELRLPVPPKAEQRRIVAKLDALTARLAHARAELDRVPLLAAKLRFETLEVAFDIQRARAANDRITSVGEIATITSGYGFPKHLQGKPTGRYPFAKVSDISQAVRSHAGDLTTAVNYVDADDLRDLRAKPVPPGSTVFAKIGEALRLNRRAIARTSIILDNNCMALSPSEAVEDEYLFFFMQTVDLSPLAVATAVPSVRRGDVASLLLPLPDRATQLSIVEKLRAAFARADRIEAEASRVRALLDRLEAAVLARAFRGELVPQDPEDEPASVLLERIRAHRAAAPKSSRRRKASTTV